MISVVEKRRRRTKKETREVGKSEGNASQVNGLFAIDVLLTIEWGL